MSLFLKVNSRDLSPRKLFISQAGSWAEDLPALQTLSAYLPSNWNPSSWKPTLNCLALKSLLLRKIIFLSFLSIFEALIEMSGWEEWCHHVGVVTAVLIITYTIPPPPFAPFHTMYTRRNNIIHSVHSAQRSTHYVQADQWPANQWEGGDQWLDNDRSHLVAKQPSLHLWRYQPPSLASSDNRGVKPFKYILISSIWWFNERDHNDTRENVLLYSFPYFSGKGGETFAKNLPESIWLKTTWSMISLKNVEEAEDH